MTQAHAVPVIMVRCPSCRRQNVLSPERRQFDCLHCEESVDVVADAVPLTTAHPNQLKLPFNN